MLTSSLKQEVDRFHAGNDLKTGNKCSGLVGIEPLYVSFAVVGPAGRN